MELIRRSVILRNLFAFATPKSIPFDTLQRYNKFHICQVFLQKNQISLAGESLYSILARRSSSLSTLNSLSRSLVALLSQRTFLNPPPPTPPSCF